MQKHRLLFFLPLLLAAAGSGAQDLFPCGTPASKVKWLEEYQKNKSGYPESNDTLYVPVSIHIVGHNSGSGYFPAKSVIAAFCTLNKDFAPSGIQFFIEGDFHYIPNSVYYNHDWDAGFEMMWQNQVPSTINCYFVESPAGNCGYSAYDLGIALAKSCSAPDDHTWAHEIGHYLSLPHPFLGWEGYTHDYDLPAPADIDGHLVERVDLDNCEFAGDGFCDTPPDYLNYRWSCDLASSLSTTAQKDPAGVNFVSDGSLFMSYSLDVCSNRFSDGQIAAMRANLEFEKFDYLYNQTPGLPVDSGAILVITPAEGTVVETYQSVPFEWEPVPNATHYLVEVSRYADFHAIHYRYVVAAPQLVSDDFAKNKTYYWRVLPFNSQHTCNTWYSEIFSFSTGSFSAVQGIEEIVEMMVQPNPLATGQQFHLTLSTAAQMELSARLVTTAGQAVAEFGWSLPAGFHRLPLDVQGISPGFYLLELRSEKGVLCEKIMIR